MTVGSLFSGIGGIDMGFQQVGFELRWAIENNHEACKTYRENFPFIPLIEEDIRSVDAKRVASVDVITAGFPCQSFSIGGMQRGFKDERGNLFFEVIRFVEVHRPQFVFLENVANLLEHDEGRTFLVIYNKLNELGYCLRYRVMRASEYGDVPQIRDRIYIVAFKNIDNCDRFSFPEPIELKTTVDSVIDRSKQAPANYYYTDNGAFAQAARKIVVDRTVIYRVYHDSIKPIKYGMCPTLTASMGTQKNQVPLLIDNYGVRKITPSECLALQGFPSNYRFPSISLESAYKQCGNTVCVPVIRRIAEQIKKVME